MATTKLLLAFLCLIALSSNRRAERNPITHTTPSTALQIPSTALQISRTALQISRTALRISSADLQICAKICAKKHASYDPNNPYLHLITIAQKQIGTREADVPNTGKKVSEYLRYTGIKIPAPWCAAWVSYVFGQAGYPAPKTAWSPALFPAARQVKEAAAGLVLGIYYPSLKRVGHCGIVERVNGDWCMSIEGNTSATNERDGDGVWRKTRHKRSIHGYADWIKGQRQTGGKT